MHLSQRTLAVLGAFALILLPLLALSLHSAQATPEQRVLVTARGDVAAVEQALVAAGATIESRWAHAGVVAARVPATSLARLATSPHVLSIFPDRTVHAASEEVAEIPVPYDAFNDVVGSAAAWDAALTGSGVGVAVLDTGIGRAYSSPPVNAFGPRVVARVNLLGGPDRDLNGHGSHVAGIIGSDLCRGELPAVTVCPAGTQGVAPGVNLISVRVLSANGAGSYANVIAGIDWVIANRAAHNIRIMNLSIAAPAVSPYWADPLNQAVMRAWEAGILVVAAAGNAGDGPGTISVPGNVPYVVTVGLLTDNYTPDDWADDYVAPISGMGPTLDGFMKPDLVAPGGHITSLAPHNSVLAQQFPQHHQWRDFHSASGTSQATAVVSGIAALLLEAEPTLSNGQVKSRLREGSRFAVAADDSAQSPLMQGAGRVYVPDVLAATADYDANEGLNVTTDLTTDNHYHGLLFEDADGFYFISEDGERIALGTPDVWTGGGSIWTGGGSIWTGGGFIWTGGGFIWTGGGSIWTGGGFIWTGGGSIWTGSQGAWAGEVPWDNEPIGWSIDPGEGSGLLPGEGLRQGSWADSPIDGTLTPGILSTQY